MFVLLLGSWKRRHLTHAISFAVWTRCLELGSLGVFEFLLEWLQVDQWLRVHIYIEFIVAAEVFNADYFVRAPAVVERLVGLLLLMSVVGTYGRCLLVDE